MLALFGHDGRTKHWGTDGINSLINLELLNVLAHKVEQTKHAASYGSKMSAAVSEKVHNINTGL